MERHWALGGSNVLFPCGLRTDEDRPAPLDLAGCYPDLARKLERRMGLGDAEHSFKLCIHTQYTSIRADRSAARRLGGLEALQLEVLGAIIEHVSETSICKEYLGIGRGNLWDEVEHDIAFGAAKSGELHSGYCAQVLSRENL